MLTEDQWKETWRTEDGKKFRAHLALMFVATPPGQPPGESDMRAYWWGLRGMTRWPGGVDNLVAAMEKATHAADKFRPSVGSIRAHALASLPDPGAQRALPARTIEPFDPLTDPELVQMRAGFSRLKHRAAEEREQPGSIVRAAVERVERWTRQYLGGRP